MKAALGYEYGCAGLRIWLRWVTDMTASGYGYDCIGLQILLRKLTERGCNLNCVKACS